MEVKPGYKQTELGVIPEVWKVVPLSKTAKRITRGASPRPIDSPVWFDSRSAIGWVRISDVTCSNRYLLETSQKLSKEGIRRSRPVPSGSLIMSICATVGRPIETRIDTCIHDGFVVFDQPCIDQSYLYHVLSALEPTWSKHGQTGSQMNLNTGLINGCLIAIPSEEAEQRAIATTLSDVDALLGELERLIAKKRDIKQAVMQQLLTGQTRLPAFSKPWRFSLIGDLLRVRHGKSQKEVESSSGVVPILGTGGLMGMARRPLYEKPSVLIGRKGTINKPMYIDVPFWTVDTLFYSEILEDNCAKFLYYKFCLIDWLQYNEASGVPSLNARTIEGVEIECPEPVEQSAIAQVISDIDAELAELERRQRKTQDIKQGMMQQLLTGKVRLA